MKFLIICSMLITYSIQSQTIFDDYFLFESRVLSNTKENQLSNRCNIDKEKNEFIISIDGAGAFNPIFFKYIKELINYNLNNISYNSIDFNTIKQVISNKTKRSASPMLNLFLKHRNLIKQNQQLLYFSHTHFKKAYKCLKKIKKLPRTKIRLIAYSWGGDTLQKIINKTKRKGIILDKAFFIDPVRKGFAATGSFKNITGNLNSKFFIRKENVREQYSVYQKTDNGSLTLINTLIKIKGNKVVGSDIDINLSKTCHFLNGTFVTHSNLHKCKQVHKLFKKFLN